MREIPLSQGQVALVDDDDYDILMQWKWHAKWDTHSRTYYARRNVQIQPRPNPRWQTIQMHALITGYAQTDHIDGNGLNNQRSNLREATFLQNSRNRPSRRDTISRFKGVTQRPNGRWWARIYDQGKMQSLGVYGTEEEAALAYNQAATEIFGEFAFLNEVPDP